MASHDFCEGVRALLEEKGGAPRWEPSSLGAASGEAIASFFAAASS